MHQLFSHSENSAKITDIPTSGSLARSRNSLKMAYGYNATWRTTYQSLSLVCRQALQSQLLLHLQHQYCRMQSIPHQQEVRARVAQYGKVRRMNQQKPKKKDKNGDSENVRGNPLLDLPEWLEEFTENLLDDSVPAQRDAPASFASESASDPRAKAVSGSGGKHGIYTHFPKDEDCEIGKRTNITRAPCRRRIGGAVPRAENFGDLITANHKVLSEGCESRNNHRYAIVVQDLATQWIQSYPCKTKTSQETQRSLQKFLEANRKPEVIYTDNSLEFGQACEDLSWNHCASTPHRSETNGIAEGAAPLQYCCNQVWLNISG